MNWMAFYNYRRLHSMTGLSQPYAVRATLVRGTRATLSTYGIEQETWLDALAVAGQCHARAKMGAFCVADRAGAGIASDAQP